MGAAKDARSDKEKKDKKDKKAKRVEADGVTKVKSDKKEKKAKKEKLASAVEEHIATESEKIKEPKEKKHKKEKKAAGEDKAAISDGEFETNAELVPFAFPKFVDKSAKKVFKAVKLGRHCITQSLKMAANCSRIAAKTNHIFRGLKEVDKNIKKYGKTKTISFSNKQKYNGLAIIAADIAPLELVLHIPAYCEEHDIKYVWVNSRHALGEAANTQRNTSIVLLVPEILRTEAQKAKAEEKKGKGEAKEVSPEDLAKYVELFNELTEAAAAAWQAEVFPWVKGVHPLQIGDATVAAA
jgi:H/ACA ribonucleoprotein complex subunit 2